MDDKRARAPRFHVDRMNIVYDTGEGYWTAPVVNMSESGIFVETHHELEAGTKVTLLPDVPEDDQLPFEIRGEVVRSLEYDPDNHYDRTPGIAFRLIGLTLENFSQLREFLRDRGVPILSGPKNRPKS